MYTYSIKQAKNTIKEGIRVYLEKNKNGYVMKEVNRLPFYLVGAPGIGKTELTSQIASELGIGFTSCSITHHSKNTVLGLPVITHLEGKEKDVKYTEYTMSEIIGKVYEQVELGYKEGILLIDEFSCMTDSLVAPMLAFLQTKNIGSHILPEGWVLILSSNPPEYNKNARIFDAAIMDRVRNINVEFDADEFIEYAESKGMNRKIIGFLKENKNYVHRVTGTGKEKEIVTCRGWENLSYCIDGLEKYGVEVIPALIAQFIKSEKIVEDFFKYYRLNSMVVDTKEYNDIIEGKNLEKIAEKYKELSYNSKLKVVKFLYGYLEMACEKYDVKMKLYDHMLKQYDLMLKINSNISNSKKNMNTGFINPVIEYDSQDSMETMLKNRRDGIESENALLINRVKGDADSNEKEAINDILLLYRTKLAMGEEEGNELVLKAYKEWLDDYMDKYKREQITENDIITNGFKFLEMLKDDLLIENFFNMLNTNMAILGVIGRCKNDKYIEYAKKIKELCNIIE